MPAKVFFYYSAMNAGKSSTLLQASYNYNERGLRTFLFIPKLIGNDFIASRIGLKAPATQFDADFDFAEHVRRVIEKEDGEQHVGCVLVDEAQFLNRTQVIQLTHVADDLRIPVLCYGLRTDFRGEPFPGSVYLLAWADEMTEIKTICKSGKKATMNARLDENGNRVTEGDQISIGLNYEAQARDVFELDKVSPIGYQIPEAN
jgi:thymidine kinase